MACINNRDQAPGCSEIPVKVTFVFFVIQLFTW